MACDMLPGIAAVPSLGFVTLAEPPEPAGSLTAPSHAATYRHFLARPL
jgi:hypothetical protein